jgi:hypothetical protein
MELDEYPLVENYTGEHARRRSAGSASIMKNEKGE